VIRIVSWVRCSGFFSGSLSSDRGWSWWGVEELSRVWIASTVSLIYLVQVPFQIIELLAHTSVVAAAVFCDRQKNQNLSTRFVLRSSNF